MQSVLFLKLITHNMKRNFNGMMWLSNLGIGSSKFSRGRLPVGILTTAKIVISSHCVRPLAKILRSC